MAGKCYEEKLSSERLRAVYESAPPRIKQHLNAEIEHVVKHIRAGDIVLELGCGYGRVLPHLAHKACSTIGIDNSISSLMLAATSLKDMSGIELACMDALSLGVCDDIFDLVVCIQNGISAFHVNQAELIRESIRVTRPGGTILFSTYSDKFWDERLRWFELQANLGLIGQIDYERTTRGSIVCKDGFTATTVSEAGFRDMLSGLDVSFHLIEIDDSSLFCVIKP